MVVTERIRKDVNISLPHAFFQSFLSFIKVDARKMPPQDVHYFLVSAKRLIQSICNIFCGKR